MAGSGRKGSISDRMDRARRNPRRVVMPKSISEHLPNVAWFSRRIIVTVVGCGGTGAQVALALPYLHQALLADGHPYGLRVFLVDGDTITETNCVRQPFARSEIGVYKT